MRRSAVVGVVVVVVVVCCALVRGGGCGGACWAVRGCAARWWLEKCVVEKPVNLKCGLRVECVGNRHDNTNS